VPLLANRREAPRSEVDNKREPATANRLETMKSGFLYVLVHPSDPDLYKIGVTILHPEERLAQHNRDFEEYAGQIVKKTGQKWEIKTYIAVPDPYWAERAFWGATHFPEIPYRGGIEIEKMEWQLVQKGLDAAHQAGVRPPPLPPKKPVRNREWMLKQLEGTGITMIGRYGGLIRHTEFQCVKGHVFKESAGHLSYRKSCPCCVVWHWGLKHYGLRASLR
jgi:hypothetical protein